MKTDTQKYKLTFPDSEQEADFWDLHFRPLFDAAERIIDNVAIEDQPLALLLEKALRDLECYGSNPYAEFALPLAKKALEFADQLSQDIDPAEFPTEYEAENARLYYRIDQAWSIIGDAADEGKESTPATKALRDESKEIISDIKTYFRDVEDDQEYLDSFRQLGIDEEAKIQQRIEWGDYDY